MKNNKQIIYWTLFCCLFFNYCSSDDNPGTSNSDYTAKADCAQTNPTYNGEIKAIFSQSCALAGCHDSNTASKGLDLQDYNQIKTKFNTYPVLCSIHWGNGCLEMPQGAPKLSDASILKITCWAKNGFPL